MGFSKLQIVNAALALLEQAPVTDFENDARGRMVDRLYPKVTESLLTRHIWGFTRRKEQMTRESASPVAHWSYAFQIPTLADGKETFRQVTAVYSTSSTNARPLAENDTWQLYGSQVLSDCPELWCDVQVKSPEGDWPPPFVDLAVYALASELAPNVMGEGAEARMRSLDAKAFQGARGRPSLLTVARRADRRGRPSRVLKDDTLIAARRGAGL